MLVGAKAQSCLNPGGGLRVLSVSSGLVMGGQLFVSPEISPSKESEHWAHSWLCGGVGGSQVGAKMSREISFPLAWPYKNHGV